MSGKAAKKARQDARNAPPTYWHGGQPGLTTGTVLVGRDDASAHGVDSTRYDMQDGYALGVTKPNRVYFSSERELARGFASQFRIGDATTGIIYQHGSLYEIEPIGEVEEDEDFQGRGVSWCAPQARILRVVEPNVALSSYQATERIGPYMTWADGSPIYGAAGEYLPSPEQVAAGVFPVWQDTLPAWTPHQFVGAWGAGDPSGDRPNSAVSPNVADPGREAHEVLLTHRNATSRMLDEGVQFRTDWTHHLADINALLPASARVSFQEDARAVVFALHPDDGVIAALVFTAAQFDGRLVMFIDWISVTPDWRGRGLGSVLLLTAQQLLPAHPDLVAGHVEPDTAAFFAARGFTILHPGTALLIPRDNAEWQPVSVGEDHSWFFRQGAY